MTAEVIPVLHLLERVIAYADDGMLDELAAEWAAEAHGKLRHGDYDPGGLREIERCAAARLEKLR